MRRGLVPLLLAVCGSCSSFDEAATSPQGSDGGALDGSNGDGGAGCPAGAFCDSFERSDPKGEWTSVQTQNGTLALDPTLASDGQRSLHATTTGIDTGRACLSLNAPRQDGLELSFDFRFEGELKNVQVAALEFEAKTYLILLHTDTGIHMIAEQTYPDGGPTDVFDGKQISSPSPAQWTHYEMVFDRGAATLAVRVGGRAAVTHALAYANKLPFVKMCLGAAYTSKNATNLWVDNVVIR